MSIYISVLILVFVLNILGFLFAYSFQTDKVTDITYSLSFICTAFFLIIFFSNFHGFHLLIALMLVLWAIRLGSFLFKRIHKIGRDKRFDSMRSSFINFGSFWVLQSISVFILVLPIIFLFDQEKVGIGVFQIIGASTWIAGFIIESLADFQKAKYKQKGEEGLFVNGLYRFVRYPNYLGEILLWCGLWFYGINYYTDFGWFTIISPIWTFALLRFISGIPLVEASRKKKYGTDPSYLKYMAKTPLLIPKFRS